MAATITQKQWERLTGKALHLGPRQPRGINKTEALYADHLGLRKAAGEIAAYWYEPFSIRLADDVRYTPDFLVQLPNAELELHEVKAGHFVPVGTTQVLKPLARDDALVKIRATASMFPFRCVIAFRHRDWDFGNWQEQEV